MRRGCRCNLSVSPLLCPVLSDSDATGDLAYQSMIDDQVADLKAHAALGEAIVGVEAVTFDARGQGALSPRALPAPKEPSQAERDRHNLTHMP